MPDMIDAHRQRFVAEQTENLRRAWLVWSTVFYALVAYSITMIAGTLIVSWGIFLVRWTLSWS